LREPAVDVSLPGVICGQREPHVAVVAAPQVVQVPGAVAHVDLRVPEVRDDEPRAPGPQGDSLRGLREELHEPDGARGGLDVRIEATLRVDHRCEHRRIEVVVPRVRAHDVLVLERVARAQVPVRLGLDDPRRNSREREQRK
jgi:hypothetical protein